MSTEGALRTRATVEVPAGVKVSLHGRELRAEGPRGRSTRTFPTDAIRLGIEPGAVHLDLQLRPDRKRAKSLLNTWEAHLANLVGGVSRGFEARLKVVAAHFPMKVQAKDGELVIENFLGEKYPRSAPLLPQVTAQVEGDIVVLSGPDVELVGQSAANIERATRIRDYDPRVFQDGIYLTEHARLREAA